MKYCSHCGTALNDNDQYCPNCGEKQQVVANTSTVTAEQRDIYDETVPGLICSIVGACICLLSYFYWRILCIVALILTISGIMLGLKRYRNNKTAFFGLCLGIAGTIAVAVRLILWMFRIY